MKNSPNTAESKNLVSLFRHIFRSRSSDDVEELTSEPSPVSIFHSSLVSTEKAIGRLLSDFHQIPPALRDDITLIERNTMRMLSIVESGRLSLEGLSDEHNTTHAVLSARHAQPGQPQSSLKVDDDFFVKLERLIEQNIANVDFTIDTLADLMCVSRSGLFYKVKNSTGETPNKLILKARLNAASKLLLEGKHSVATISYMVGFNNPSYFSRCFMKYFGETPHKWVEQQTASGNLQK